MQEISIGEFKSKYGISNAMVGSLLRKSPKEIKDLLVNDTFSDEDKRLFYHINVFVERIISEGELLAGHAPLIQVLQHEIEKICAINEDFNQKLTSVRTMKFWSRMKFLFRPSTLLQSQQ